MKVAIVGRGKVGRTLARAAREAGLGVASHAGRSPLPGISADLVVIATRDEAIDEIAGRLTLHEPHTTAVVHCAGARGLEPLLALREAGVSLGVMHPAISMVDDAGALAGAVVVGGDPAARERVAAFAARLGLAVVVAETLDRGLYHAAMALVANGAATLAAAACELAERAGLEAAHEVIGPLLASVGHNVARLGPQAALSGPVRRGSSQTVQAHLDRIAAVAPDQLALYRAVVRAQLPLARAIGEAPPAAIAAIERALEE